MKQPTATTCGQTCVAILAGVEVEESCRAVGKRGPTRTRDVVRGLRALGVECADRLLPLRQVRGLVPTAVVRMVKAGRRTGHWVVWRLGRYEDPADGLVWAPEDFTAEAALHGWRAVSVLPVGAGAGGAR